MIGKTLNKISIVLLLLVVGTAIVGIANAAQPTGGFTSSINKVADVNAAPQTVPQVQCLATCPTTDGNSVADTNSIISSWTSQGYTATTLLTSTCTQANVKNYWQNDGSLSYYNNIGHSDTTINGAPCNGLYFYDGEISASTIQNLNPATGIQYSWDFVNSCNSYENPMLSAFTAHNVQMYVGGIINLPSPSSENTDASFWYNGFQLHQTPKNALQNAENSWGTGSDFLMYGGY